MLTPDASILWTILWSQALLIGHAQPYLIHRFISIRNYIYNEAEELSSLALAANTHTPAVNDCSL